MRGTHNITDGPNTISILLTTDNHVGYKESDPILGNDSWITFHEITQIAKDKDVDMILQGGDLFHINKPSKKSMFHVIKSLRMNCMGDRPCEMELLSDPATNFTNGFNTVNYEDANLNISIPVFAISGNHDDATGDAMLSPLDVLSVAGLVNHFGKIDNNEDITVSPVLLQKGTTKLALYGMANVRDERLHRAFRDGLVKFQRPNIYTDEWFNLLCIHQNHAEHSRTSHIPETFLPKFLDFILWGHEHECIPNPVFNPDTGFDVLQAGSSIATSLSDGEQREKYVFIMRINGTNYSLEPVKLKTVRPFLLDEVVLQETRLIPGEASKADVINFLVEHVESLIQRANDTFMENNPDLFHDPEDAEINKKRIPLPLIRLKVEYSGGYELENARRLSNKFVERIGNVNDVIQFYKKKTRNNDPMIQKTKFSEAGLLEDDVNNAKTSEVQLQDLINVFLQQTELNLLPEQGITHAVGKFVENDDKHIINQYINNEIEQETRMLLELNINHDDLYDEGDQQAKKVFRNLLKKIKSQPRNFDESLPKTSSVSNPKSKKPIKSLKERKANKKSTEIVSDLGSDISADDGCGNNNMGFDLSDMEIVTPQPPSSRKTRKTTNTKPIVVEIDSDTGDDDEYHEEIIEKTPLIKRETTKRTKSISRPSKPSTRPPLSSSVATKGKKSAAKIKESGNGSLFDNIMSMGS